MAFNKRWMWFSFFTLTFFASWINVGLAQSNQADSQRDLTASANAVPAPHGGAAAAADPVASVVNKSAKTTSSFAAQSIPRSSTSAQGSSISAKATTGFVSSNENAIMPARSKVPQDFVRGSKEAAIKEVDHTKISSVNNDFQLFDTIKPTQNYKTRHSFSLLQSPSDLQLPNTASKISTQDGSTVNRPKLKAFFSGFQTMPTMANADHVNVSTTKNHPSAFIEDIEAEDQRTMANLKKSKPNTVSQFSSTAGISILSSDGTKLLTLEQDLTPSTETEAHVEIKEVLHRNDFASVYQRRLLSRADYISYFNWVNDAEIEELHAKIMDEFNNKNKLKDQSQRQTQNNRMAWSNMAMSNIDREKDEGNANHLSVSNDPRQELSLALALGVTNNQSSTVSNSDLPIDAAVPSDLPTTGTIKRASIFDLPSDSTFTGLPNLATSEQSGEQQLPQNLIARDTGELSPKALTDTYDNPFSEDQGNETTLSVQKSDFDPVSYLDQLLPDENIEAVTTQAPPSTIFDSIAPNVVEDTSANNGSMPFKVSARFEENRVIFDIDIVGRSYLYQDSLKFESKDGISFNLPNLPNGQMHEDMQGTSYVYFEHLTLDVPITKCLAGDVMTLNYQGCDEQGICYPVQSYSISMPNAILIKTEDTGFVNLINNSFNLLQDGQEGSIAELLRNNLLLGLLICFILGIGLDLTPCVLPMLPIFSTMLVGSCKNKINLKDDVEIEADKAAAKIDAKDATDVQDAKAQQPSADGDSDSGSNSDSDGGSAQADTAQAAETGAKVKRLDGEFKTIVFQNLGYTIGLSLTYMVLGLLFASLGASLHSFLQSSEVIIFIAILLCVCALSCAGVIELKVPNFITIKLQDKISNLNTGRFSGAVLFGMLSALIASPCTSAPLAGALLYIFTTGNQLLGALCFLAIGLGMAFPLFLIGVFGSKFLSRSRIVGDLVKRLLVVVLLITAYMLVHRLLGSFDLILRTMLIYVVCVYILISFFTLLLRHNLQMSQVLVMSLFSLIPSYAAYNYFEETGFLNKYEFFTRVETVQDLESHIKNKYSFVVFTADWCTNCAQMEREVYSNDRFTLAANDLNKLMVDISDTQSQKTKDFIKEFNLVGVPCYILLDPAGNIVEKRLGIQSNTTVINSIHRLKYKSKYNL